MIGQHSDRSSSRPWANRFGSVRPSTVAVAVAVLAFAVLYPLPHATAWHFFRDAAHALFDTPRPASDGGLDLYREHPEFQFGPVSIIAAAPFAYLPSPAGVFAAMAAASLLGVVTATALYDIIGRTRPSHGHTSAVTMMFGVSTLIAVWSDIAVRTTHLDDAIALAATAGAIGAIDRRRPWLGVALLAVAAAAKPWAIMFAPLALAVPGRHAIRRLAVLGALVVAAWLPFVLDEPGTVHAAASFKITNAAASALRALGVANATTPPWVRPAQLGLGLVAATLLVRTGRWHTVLMATVAIRLILDPAVHHYYTAGLVAGVLLWEGISRPGRFPVVTMLSAAIAEATAGTPHPAALAGGLRLMLLVALVIAAARTSPMPKLDSNAEPRTGHRVAAHHARGRRAGRVTAPRLAAPPEALT